MACLRTARAHGHLELSNIMSSGLVSTECIKQGLVHQHSQVKVNHLCILYIRIIALILITVLY